MSEPEIDIASDEQALFSRIALNANPRKVDYLGNRACGFSTRESCNLSNISIGTLHKWRREDPEFAEFESNKLYELQRNIGPDILRLGFLRNFKLFLKIDFKVLYKASLRGLDVGTMSEEEAFGAGITSREFEYIKAIRKEYTPAAMLALHRALEPEASTDDNRSLLDRVVVIVNNEIVEGEVARRAAGKALLDQWTANKEMLPEGEKEEAVE